MRSISFATSATYMLRRNYFIINLHNWYWSIHKFVNNHILLFINASSNGLYIYLLTNSYDTKRSVYNRRYVAADKIIYIVCDLSNPFDAAIFEVHAQDIFRKIEMHTKHNRETYPLLLVVHFINIFWCGVK